MRAQPNLCLFTESFGHGGTERQFTELATRLDRAKYHVEIACLKREGQFYEQLCAAGLRTFEFPIRSWMNPVMGKVAFDWIRFLRRQKITLVHSFDLYTNIFAAPLARLARVPVVVTSLRAPLDVYSPRQRWMQQRAFRWSHCVVANSQFSADGLAGQNGFPAARVRVLRNGVDLERFYVDSTKHARERLGWPADKLLIAVVGNLRAEKDHRTLLDAAPGVIAHVPNAHFMIVGTGPLEAELRRYAESRKVISNVTFLGNREDVPDILAAIDLAVLPTLLESLPNVILEAMSAGRVMIASDAGGCRELIEHGRWGILVPPRDPQRLAQEIIRLLQQTSLREEMGRAARRQAETEFNIKVVVARLEAIYDELLARLASGTLAPPARVHAADV